MDFYVIKNTMSRYMTVRNPERVIMISSVRSEPISFIHNTYQQNIKQKQAYVNLINFNKKNNSEKVTLEIARRAWGIDEYNNTIHKFDLENDDGKTFVEDVLSLSRMDIFIADSVHIDTATTNLIMNGIILDTKSIVNELDDYGNYISYLEKSIRNYE